MESRTAQVKVMSGLRWFRALGTIVTVQHAELVRCRVEGFGYKGIVWLFPFLPVLARGFLLSSILPMGSVWDQGLGLQG